MKPAKVTEYRVLSASRQTVVMSVFAEGLPNTALVQLLRIETGIARILSIFAVYREASMTFEASAKLSVDRPGDSLELLLHDLILDADFLDFLFTPIRREVNRYFARVGC